MATTKKTTTKKSTAKKTTTRKTTAKKATAKKTTKRTVVRRKSISKEEFLMKVRDAAYEIYLKRDHNDGDEITDWLAAEVEVGKKFKVK